MYLISKYKGGIVSYENLLLAEPMSAEFARSKIVRPMGYHR